MEFYELYGAGDSWTVAAVVLGVICCLLYVYDSWRDGMAEIETHIHIPHNVGKCDLRSAASRLAVV